ncbi:MAG: hypothetical protein ACOYXU_00065 [Nitrospirota bacterium]
MPQTGGGASRAPAEASDEPVASQPTGRKAVIKEEIQQFLKEQAEADSQNQRQAPVSQDDIDTLFRR